MKTVVQQRFSPPSSLEGFHEEPLVIHQRTDTSSSRHLVVFVHGLGGSRYGEHSTFGSLPAYLFEDCPELDVGLYSFRTALRRLKFWRSIPVPREADVLADVLRTLRKDLKYDWFILVGHSLGGLLCKGAIAALADKNQRHSLERISDLMLMATPQLGSLRVPGFLRWITQDARVLRAHSDFVQRVMTVFQERIHCAVNPPMDDKPHLRAWAVIAAADQWVDALSAGVGIEESQRLTVAGSHTEVVKPADKNAESYRFVLACLKVALQPRVLPFRTERCRSVTLNELSDLRQFASEFFTEPISELGLMEEWWQANQDVFQVVERIVKAKGRVHTETVGYFCVIPLTVEAVERLKSGDVTGTSLTAKHMPASGDAVSAVYVGGVAGIDKASQGAALHFLQAHLRYIASGAALRVLARPVTEDGLTLVRGHAFHPVKTVTDSGMGIVHENTLDGLRRGLGKTRQPRVNLTSLSIVNPGAAPEP